MWIFGWKGPSGFSASSTAEQVTQGIDGTALTAIVTGASSGLGVETTRVLALRGVHVVMAIRNMDAGRTVKEAILKEIPGAKIDVRSELNGFSHFLLTDLLLETMKNTARESNIEGRIVILSSEAHRFAYEIYNLHNAMRFTQFLNLRSPGRWGGDYSKCTSSWSNYDQSCAPPGIGHMAGKYFLKNVPQGAATTCYVALNPQVKGVSREYFLDSNISNPSSKAKDADLAKRLWDFSLTLTNPK